MEQLSYGTLKQQGFQGFVLENAPERVLQFGEGNFLRAFADYFIDVANEKSGFNTKVVVAQPIAQGLAHLLNEQEGLYTTYLRGYKDGNKVNEKRVCSCISRAINPYEDYAALLEIAHNPQLRYIISNTTEAGIVFDAACGFEDAPPASFPAKLTRFLYERFTSKTAGDKGLVVLSCELIDNNGGELKRCVEEYIRLWKLEAGFAQWVEANVLFCNTLVDRIVTGYPAAEAAALNAENGYEDKLLVAAEVFGLWVIEGPESLGQELPFAKAGLPVIVVPDHTPYKQRKVRILNGAHTSLVLAAYLSGKDIVRDCMEDAVTRGFMEHTIYQEIIPTLTLPKAELEEFAASVTDRFANPFIDHSLLAISLNSVAKWKARLLPSLQGYVEKNAALPANITFSLAALIAFYSGVRMENGAMVALRGTQEYTVKDDEWVLEAFLALKDSTPAQKAAAICGDTRMWGEDLCSIPGLENAVAGYLEMIRSKGMAAALAAMQQEG